MYYVQLNFSAAPSVIPGLHKVSRRALSTLDHDPSKQPPRLTAAPPAPRLQLFNTPVVGREPVLLRFMTLRK